MASRDTRTGGLEDRARARQLLIHDHDANATTPAGWLEALWGPFLARGLPIGLALIPEVRLDARTAEGEPERYLRERGRGTRPLAANPELARLAERFEVLQHGCTHERVAGRYEFDRHDAADAVRRLERGRARLREAGLEPVAFAAPQDLYTPASFREAARRYPAIVNGRFWPRWLPLRSRLGGARRAFGARLLRHAGEPDLADPAGLVDALGRGPTIWVFHHWRFFDAAGRAKARPLAALHRLAERLAEARDVEVVRVADLL